MLQGVREERRDKLRVPAAERATIGGETLGGGCGGGGFEAGCGCNGNAGALVAGEFEKLVGHSSKHMP